MADPIIKRIDEHPNLVGVAAIDDKVLGIDASQSAPAQKTVLIAMNQLSIHSPSQLAANVVEGTKIKDGAVTPAKTSFAPTSTTTNGVARFSNTSGSIKDTPTFTIADTGQMLITTTGHTAMYIDGADSTNTKYVMIARDGAGSNKFWVRNDGLVWAGGNMQVGGTLAVTGSASFGGTVTATLANNSIGTAQIANGAVTEAKLGTIKRTLFLRVSAPNDTLTVGSTTNFFPFPISLDNFIVVDARINLVAASSSGTVTVALLNQGGTMTTLSLAAGQTGMSASGTISTSYRTAITNNFLGVNCTAAGTGAKGLSITLVLQGVPA